MADSVPRTRLTVTGVWPRSASPRLAVRKVLTGLRAARTDLVTAVTPPVAGIALAEIVVLLVWISDGQVDADAFAALRVGADLWLMAHGTSLGIPDGDLAMVPFGMALIPIVLTALAGHRIAYRHGPLGAAGRPGTHAGWGMATVVVSYVLVAVLIAVVADDPAAHPSIPSTLLGAGLLSLIGAGAGVLGATRGESWRSLIERVPADVRVIVTAAVAAVAVLVAAGSLITAVVFATHVPEMAQSADRLTPGGVGGVGLFLVQLMLLPNIVVWAAAYVLGPGFATGVHGVVRPSYAQVTHVADLPMLAGLPTDRIPAPLWLLLALAPATAGCVVARLARRDAPARVRLYRALLASLLCGMVMATVAAASGGSLGSGELASFGPSGPWVGIAATMEVGLVATLATTVATIRGRRVQGPELRVTVTAFWKRCWHTAGSWLGSLRHS